MRKTETSLEKRMKNRRFKKTEDKILTVFFRDRNITIIKMAKNAGIGRSTMYDHHHAVKEILPDYQKYMIAEYRFFMRKTINRHIPLKTLYLELLIFILKNKKIFKLFFKYRDTEVLKYMIKYLRTKVSNYAHLPKNSDKIFTIYTNEVIGIIEGWGESGFSEQKINSVLADITYLTETCRSRLMPINY